VKIEVIGTVFFALAVVHTFLVAPLNRFSEKFPKDSFRRGLFHLLGEVEVVFGFWATLFLGVFAFMVGKEEAIKHQTSLSFTEPLFVFAIMVMASTRPVMRACRHFIRSVSRVVRLFTRTPETQTDIFFVMTLGPLAGSFITEPAAMTVTALLIGSMIEKYSTKLLYFMIGVLFVNVSIGGALTPYAAPPILMVAGTWQWDFAYVFGNFGLKSVLAVTVNAVLFVGLFWKEIGPGFYTLTEATHKDKNHAQKIPAGVTILHFVFLILVVATAHYPQIFMGIFLLFLGVTTVTKKYQDDLRMRESLLVGFFLAGLIVFGPMQRWWLQPLLTSLTDWQMFFGATGLTAITDNAALTYLGSQVVGLSESSKYALVAGAIAGGGLTIIANAPNPAGYSLLADKFPKKVINPFLLFAGALIPTLVAVISLWYLF
jgi:hypothetical protein